METLSDLSSIYTMERWGHGGYREREDVWPPRWLTHLPAATVTTHGGMATHDTQTAGSVLETSTYDHRTVFKMIFPQF